MQQDLALGATLHNHRWYFSQRQKENAVAMFLRSDSALGGHGFDDGRARVTVIAYRGFPFVERLSRCVGDGAIRPRRGPA